jgi:hypothetical protein
MFVVAGATGALADPPTPPATSGSQPPPPFSTANVTLGHASGPVRLDGVLDEADWQTAGLIPNLVQQSPVPEGETPYRTEVRLMTSGETLFVGVRCFDPDPRQIATHTMQRDADLASDDAVGLVFDTFGDHRTGYVFRVNASGARYDGLVNTPEDVSADWDGIWDAHVHRDDTGWTVEFAIPAATLRFASGLDAWGFNVQRTVARDRTEVRWTGTTLDARFPDMRRAGSLAGVARLDQGLGLTISPYGLARHGNEYALDDSKTTGDAGLDVGWAMTRELSGVLTINPDFAETEVDTRQINLTRFPLFYPEKRYFFVEGANQFVFGPNLGTDFVPFFSRRVGLVGGDIVPIDAGAKVIGRQGPWGIGALSVRTQTTPAAPAATLSAVRVARDVGEHLRLGGIGTSGDPTGLTDNWLAGADAVWQTSTFRGDQNLATGAWYSHTGGDAAPPDSPNGPIPGASENGRSDAWGALLDFPNDRWDNAFSFKSFGAGFNPALGFLPRTGIRLYRGHVAFQPRPQSAPWSERIRQMIFAGEATVVTDHSGLVQTWLGGVTPFGFQTPAGAHFEVDWLPEFERLDAPFEVSDSVLVAPGAYHFQQAAVVADSRPDRPLRYGASWTGGGFYDGSLSEWSGYVRWATRPGRLQLEAEGLYIEGRLPAGDFIEQLWQQRIVYAFSPDLVLSLYTQYDSVSSNLGTNARLRYTIRPGTDLYVVWNRGWVHPPGAESGSELDLESDQAVVKLRFTWRPARSERVGRPEEPAERRGSIPPALGPDSAGVASRVAGDSGLEAGISQGPAGRARRGAGVAEQGCLLSSYPG